MAMDMNAALKITTQVEGANKIVDLQRGLAGVESTAKTVTGALNGMAGASQGLFSALGALTPLLSVAGLVGMAKGALDSGQEMLHMSEKTGLSVEQLAKFKKAAALANVDLETVGKSVVKFDKSMVDAFANGKSAKFFDVLGISVKDASGHLKDNNQVLLEVADKFKAMPDGAAKTAIAIGLLGKAGAEAIPFLNQGGKAIDAMSSSMTKEFAEAADKYKQQLSALNGQVFKLGIDLAQSLLPALSAVTQAVVEAAKWFNGLPGPVKQSIEAIAGLSIAWATFTSLMSVLPALTTALEAFWAALTGPVGIAIAALVLVTEAAYNLSPPFRQFINEFPERFAAFFKDMSALASQTFAEIADQLSTLGKTISDIWKSVTKDLSDRWHNIITAMGGDNGWFVSGVKNMASSIASAFGGLMTWLSQHWKQMVAEMIDVLIPVAGAVKILSGGKADLGMVAANAIGTAYKDFTTPIAGQKEKDANSAASFNPDLPGGAAKLGKLDTAAINEAAKLAGEIKIQEAKDKELTWQANINELLRKANVLSAEGNTLDALAVQDLAARKEDELERYKIYQEMYAKLKENQGVTSQANREEKDRLVILEAHNKLKEEANKFDNKHLELLEKVKETERQIQIQQKNALQDISNQYTDKLYGASHTSDQLQEMQKLRDLKRQIGDTENTELKARLGLEYQAWEEYYAKIANLGNNATYGIAKGTQDYISGIGTLADSIAGATKGAFSQLETELTSFFETGKLNFKAFADYAIKELMRIVLEQTLLKPLASGIGGLFNFGGPAAAATPVGNLAAQAAYLANGGIMSSAGLMPLNKYAGGGVANSPQMAIFGEGSTPEAYVPLPDGRRIPVNMKGGGGSAPVVNVAVDAKGTSVSGDSGQSAALGRAIAASVQAELIKQKRPGGLLAA